ncbi:MAG: 3'-5' exonuclease [Rudanella sp.]|nr:3'-5' exonuclease [Rudanella sp.]
MPYVVLDLEMSGPDPDYNEIIQIGAVLFDDDWIEKGRYLSNVYPENEEAFTASAEKVHNLSLSDLEDAPMIYDVLPELEEWIIKNLGILKQPNSPDNMPYLRNVVICGQSVMNDIQFLKEAYRLEKLKWPYSRVLVDLHTLSYFVFRLLKKKGKTTPRGLSLKDVSGYFGLERKDDFHNALEDAVLTAACLKRLFQLSDGFQLTD